MEIKAKDIGLVGIDLLVENPKKLIEILKCSKNLIRFTDEYCEMQAFSQDQEEFSVKIDYVDIERVSKIKWRAQRNTDSYVAIVATFEKSTIVQSRAILRLGKDLFCDHINGDPTDNRRNNLRIASHSQNMRNRKSLKKGNKYKGIYFDKSRFRWVAQIAINGKNTSIGRFYTEKQAALAYNEMATKHYGDFAKINEIKND